MREKTTTRRRVLRLLASGAVSLPVGSALLAAMQAQAQDVPRLPEDDPAASALGYVHDASDVDLSKYPRYKPGQICANCQQWQGREDEQWAPCAIFPGREVSAPGWCSVWVRVAG